MGLFDKKFCDVCGAKIGLLGNRKLADGNLCKDCAKKLSPWFSDRRESTVAEIKEQLAYREGNKAAVAAFHTTRTLGTGTRVLLDEDAGRFMVATTDHPGEENPDVIGFGEVTGCSVTVDEYSREITQQNSEGKQVSCFPKRWNYSYDFKCVINVNNRWFDDITFRLNPNTVNVEVTEGASAMNPTGSPEYQQYIKLGDEIKTALMNAHQQVRAEAAAAKAPKAAVTCPHCGATAVPDEHGCCPYCGGAMNA